MGQRRPATSATCTLEVQRKCEILEAMLRVLMGEAWDPDDIEEDDLNEMVPSLMVTKHELTSLLRELNVKMCAAATSGADSSDEDGQDDDDEAASFRMDLVNSRDDGRLNVNSGEGDH